MKVDGDKGEFTTTTDEKVRTLDDLIRVCKIDTSTWEVERFICNKYEQASVPRAVGNKRDGWRRASTEPVVTALYQVKAWLRRRVAIVAARQEIASLIADAKRRIPARPEIVVRRAALNPLIMLEPHIPDLHVGKLAWGKETGDVDYDAHIARSVFEKAIDAIIERTIGHGIGQIVFPVGNDLLHSDTKQGTTTGGTQLDTDSRYHKNFVTARRLITNAIERFRAIAPVRVVMVPGNHDTLSVWHLGDSLECLYHRDADVEVDNAPTMRKYHRHGKVMLMFAHGNRGKLDQYPLLMATEQPEMFGATVHREAHTGDKHQLRVQEHRGVKVRISPALCPPDAWHAENLFTGNQRAAEAFVWHAEEGLIATANYVVPGAMKAAA
jgi:hypothetical protein